MPDAIEEVFRRVDLDRPRFTFVERRRVPDDAWTRLVDLGVVRRIEDAEWVTCASCGDGEDVVFAPTLPGQTRRAYSHCRENGTVRIDVEHLQQWQVDPARLAQALAETFSCAGRVEELVPGRLWLLGRTMVGGRSREVFFGRRLPQPDGAQMVGGCRRFLAGVAPVVLVAGVIPDRAVWSGDPPPVLAIPSFVTLEGGRLVADRAYVESALATSASAKPDAATASFPTPHGATWSDVRLVVTDFDVEIAVRGKSARYTFTEAGFEDARKGGVPDNFWRLLQLFASRGGVVPFDAPGLAKKTRDNLKQHMSELRRRLCALLQISDDPFRPTRTSRRYETLFAISTTETVILPVPDGARWEDVAIEEVAPDRIRFSFDAVERTPARGARRDDEDVSWDVAERVTDSHREYDLVTLGLAHRDGGLNAEGLVLRELLRSGGVVTRPANDKATLALGGRLSRMAQIAAPAKPFEFSDRAGRWTAQFDASSALADAAR